jgi:outer membrane biosynthesis protein TonB
MLTLIVRQSLKNGTAKTWKLRPTETNHTFGSSRLANVISISGKTRGIQGVFEFKDGKWWYIDLDQTQSLASKTSPSICLDVPKSLVVGDSTLEFQPIKKEVKLYESLENAAYSKVAKGTSVQLYIVKQGAKVLETRVLPLGTKFRAESSLIPAIACIPGETWNRQMHGNLEVSQRTIAVENAAHLAKISADQLVDEESKKGVYAVLGLALLMVSLAIFTPKNEVQVAVAPPPKLAQKIIVKNEVKPKRQKVQAAAPAPTPQKVVVQEPPKAAPGPKVQMPTGSKVANLMKAVSGGRISQLLGKVSAQAAKSGNIIVANGVKAGSGPSGRALASLGRIEQSGRDWGSEGSGKGVRISTAGRGGGGSATGMGGLAAGGTGSGGVGLIEEEGEITGGLDREIIAQYIKSQLGQILYCYERQLSANPDLFGKVAIKFTIGPTGGVEKQNIGDTTLKNATVEGCILNRVAAWKFPAPQGGTRVLVTYPFLFKSTN